MQKSPFPNLNAMKYFATEFSLGSRKQFSEKWKSKKRPFEDSDLTQMAIKETRLKETCEWKKGENIS